MTEILSGNDINHNTTTTAIGQFFPAQDLNTAYMPFCEQILHIV